MRWGLRTGFPDSGCIGLFLRNIADSYYIAHMKSPDQLWSGNFLLGNQELSSLRTAPLSSRLARRLKPLKIPRILFQGDLLEVQVHLGQL